MSKLLSYGGFGCVFHPAFNCNGKLLTDKYVNKIQKKNFNSTNEIHISFLIKQMDNYDKFFLPILSSCNLNLRKINKENVKECKLIKNVESKKYVSFKFKYFDNYKIKDIYKNLASNKSNIQLSIFLFNSYRLLLEGLIKLNSLNIVHFDLKTDNILFDKNTFYPKIIDFGISIPLDNLNKDNILNYFYVFAPEYYIWSLEIHFINYLLYEKNTLNKDDIERITDEYYDNYFFKNLNKNDLNLLIINSLDFFSKYIDKKKEFVIYDLLNFSNTWDNYSLSILFLTMINKKQTSFYNLLLNNINSNPDKRLSLEKSLETFNNIMSDIDFNNIYIDNNIEMLTKYTNTVSSFKYIIKN
jgi:serine/threonine protein kinase